MKVHNHFTFLAGLLKFFVASWYFIETYPIPSLGLKNPLIKQDKDKYHAALHYECFYHSIYLQWAYTKATIK